MTAVIAVFDPDTGAGAMAADSGMSGIVNMRSRPKIRRLGGAFVASSGSVLAGEFLDCLVEANPGTGREPLTLRQLRGMADGWRGFCTERGCFEQEGALRGYPSNFLILAPAGIFEILRSGSLFHHPPETRAVAIGIGAEVCMGAALMGIAHHNGSALLPEDWLPRVASDAVLIAIDLCDGCAAPVQVEKLEAPPPPPEPGAQLGAQLLKLIEHNNIDRAIKLCNQEISRAGKDPFVVACKAMLVDAHKGEQTIRSALAKHVDAVPASEWASALLVRDALIERAR